MKATTTHRHAPFGSSINVIQRHYGEEAFLGKGICPEVSPVGLCARLRIEKVDKLIAGQKVRVINIHSDYFMALHPSKK